MADLREAKFRVLSATPESLVFKLSQGGDREMEDDQDGQPKDQGHMEVAGRQAGSQRSETRGGYPPLFNFRPEHSPLAPAQQKRQP